MSSDSATDESRLSGGTIVLATVCAGLGLWIGYEIYAAEGALLGALLGAAFGLGLDLALSSQQSRRTRAKDAIQSWSSERGLVYNARSPVFRDTPVLLEGSSQEGRHGFTGEIFGLRGTVYEHITRYGSEQGSGGESRHLIVLHLALDLPRIALLRVHPRHPGATNAAGSLANRALGDKEVELESTALSRRCRIDVNQSCDQVWLRRLFTAQTTATLADLCESELFARGLYLEAEGGKVVIAMPGRIDPLQLERLDAFLAAIEPVVVHLEQFAAEFTPAAGGRESGSGGSGGGQNASSPTP